MFSKAFTLLALAGMGSAHMHLHYPPTFKGDNNPNTQGDPDPELNYPYGCCGKEPPGPCKGYVDLLDTDEGKPVATWTAGQNANFSLSGSMITGAGENPEGGTHYGGSCQVGFSTDKGKTFKVATTYQGNCPLRANGATPEGQTFDFTVPADLPSAERVLFAWTWVNREKEFYMNCASVTIEGGSGGGEDPDDQPSAAPSATPSASPEAPTGSPVESPSSGPSPTGSPDEAPAPSQSPSSPQEPAGSAQYTLDGCSCSCPYQTWSSACSCYECKSPATKRHIVERKVLQLHRRRLEQTAKLNSPHRRAESDFSSRPDMLISIDYDGATCQSKGNSVELEWPEPGPDVVQGDGEYPLEKPTCS